MELHEKHAPGRRGGDRRSIRFKGSSGKVAAPKNAVTHVADLLGETERGIRRKVSIGRNAVPEVHDALREGRINVLEAEKLSRLPVAEQARRVAQPDGDRDVKRALSALAFAECTLGERKTISADLAEELHTHLGKLGAIAKKLKTSQAPRRDPNPALAVDFTPKSVNRKLSPIDMRPGRQRPQFTPRRPVVSTTFTSISATCHYVAANVRRLRLSLGWTQEQLAERASIETRYVHSVEAARANPTVKVLVEIAEALETDSAKLFAVAKFSKASPGRPRRAAATAVRTKPGKSPRAR